MSIRVFVSHASDDKVTVAKPIADLLIRDGYAVWYDEYSLKTGDSLSESIDAGLSSCDFGIVILSPAFLSKNWTRHELRGLVAKEMVNGKQVILPVWHQLNADALLRVSPTLVDRKAATTAEGLTAVVEALKRAMGHPSVERMVAEVVSVMDLDIFRSPEGVFFPHLYRNCGNEGRAQLLDEFEALKVSTPAQVDCAVGILGMCLADEDNPYLAMRLESLKRAYELEQVIEDDE